MGKNLFFAGTERLGRPHDLDANRSTELDKAYEEDRVRARRNGPIFQPRQAIFRLWQHKLWKEKA